MTKKTQKNDSTLSGLQLAGICQQTKRAGSRSVRSRGEVLRG
jgi:hypothetical protein